MAFKKILVPLDGSPNSELVLGPATGLAKALGAELILLGVVTDLAAEAMAREVAKATDGQRAVALRYLEDEAARVASNTMNVSCRVARGKPAETIVKQAKAAGADMIAMATHRGNVIERGILGSVTDSVLRTSPVPVLAVRPTGVGVVQGNDGAPNVVVVPLDGSALAEKAVPVALEIAESCSAELIFVRAVLLPSYAVAGPGIGYYDVSYGVTGERRAALEYLSQFVKQAEARGLKARAHAALGSPAARILEDIKSVDGAMVVISSHGRGGVRRMMLGSVADKIVRASRHPVLVLTPAPK
jgi:nucleotide-binding universal stress UspA family protein